MFMPQAIAMLECPDGALLPIRLSGGPMRRCLLGTTYDHAGEQYVWEGRTSPGGVPIFVRPAPARTDGAPEYETQWSGDSPDHTGGHSKGRLMDECGGFVNPLYGGLDLVDVPYGTLPSELSLRTWGGLNPMSQKDRVGIAMRANAIRRRYAPAGAL